MYIYIYIYQKNLFTINKLVSTNKFLLISPNYQEFSTMRFLIRLTQTVSNIRL